MSENERMDVELKNEGTEGTEERKSQKQAPWWIWPLVAMVAIVVLSLAWNPFPKAQAEKTAETEVLAEAIAIAIVSQEKNAKSDIAVAEEDSVTAGSQLEEAISVVEFVEGWDSNGKFIATGSTINGPAIIKPNPNTAEYIAVYPGKSFTLTNDSVVWLYTANERGLESQFQFFGKQLQAIK